MSISYALALTYGTDSYTVPASSLVYDSFNYTKQYLNGLKSGSQTVKLQIRGSDLTTISWILQHPNSLCNLVVDGIPGDTYKYNFRGYVSETISWGFSTEGYKVLQITLEDARSRLDVVYSTEDTYYSGTLTSIIADICDKCDLTVGTDISGSGSTEIAKLISKDTKCRDILDEVCLECCAYYVIDGYTLNLRSIQAAPEATTIDQSIIYDKSGTAVALSRTIQQYTCAQVKYDVYATTTGELIFNDDSLSESNPHTLAANHYYPGDKEITATDPGTPSSMEVSYRQTGKTLVNFTNLVPTFITDPACTCSMTKKSANEVSLLIKNTHNIGSLIKKISASADITYIKDTNWVNVGTDTSKRYETEAEWIHNNNAAKHYVNLLQQYYHHANYAYTFYTKTPLELGKYYTFNETLYSHINTKVLITKVEYSPKYQANAPLYKVTAVGWDTFSLEADVTETSRTNAPIGGTGTVGPAGPSGPSAIKQYALSTSSINPPPVDEHGVFTTPITPEAAWKHGTYIWSQIVYSTTPATVADTHYEQDLTESWEATKLLSVTVSPFAYTKNMRARGTSDKTEIELTFINIDYYDYDTITVSPSCGTYDPTTQYVTIPYATADEVCNIGIVLTKSGTQVGATSISLEAAIIPQQWLNLGSFTTTPIDSDGKIIGGTYVGQYAMEGDVYLDVSGTTPVAKILDRNLQPAKLVDSAGTSNYDDKLLSLFPAAFGDNTTNHTQIEGYDCFKNVITDHITANYIGSKEIQVLDKIYAGTIDADNPWGERVTSANGFLLDRTGNMEARNCYLRDVRASNMTLGADCNISGVLDNDVIKTNIVEGSDTTTYTSSSANKNVDAFSWSDGNIYLQAWASTYMNPGTASYLTGSYAGKTWYSAVNYMGSVPTTVSLYSNSSWAPEGSTTTKYNSVAVCARRIRVRGQQYACANAFYKWMTPYVRIVIGGTEHTIVSHNSGSDWASQGVNIPSYKASFDATYTVPAGQSFSIVVEGRDYTLNSWNGSLYIDERPAEIYNIGLTLFQEGATTGYRVDDLVGYDNYCRSTPNLKIGSYTVFAMDFTDPTSFPAPIHPLYLFEWTGTAPTPGSWSFFESSSLSLTNENGVEVTADDWTSASWDAIHISATSSDSTATLSNTSFVRSFNVSFKMKSQVKAVYTKHIIPKAPDETWDLPGTDTWDIGASETLRYRNGFFKNVNTERLTIGGVTYALSVSGSSLVLTPVTD